MDGFWAAPPVSRLVSNLLLTLFNVHHVTLSDTDGQDFDSFDYDDVTLGVRWLSGL